MDEWFGRCLVCWREYKLQLSPQSESVLPNEVHINCVGPMCKCPVRMVRTSLAIKTRRQKGRSNGPERNRR
jgi:hypothetical protein